MLMVYCSTPASQIRPKWFSVGFFPVVEKALTVSYHLCVCVCCNLYFRLKKIKKMNNDTYVGHLRIRL